MRQLLYADCTFSGNSSMSASLSCCNLPHHRLRSILTTSERQGLCGSCMHPLDCGIVCAHKLCSECVGTGVRVRRCHDCRYSRNFVRIWQTSSASSLKPNSFVGSKCLILARSPFPLLSDVVLASLQHRHCCRALSQPPISNTRHIFYHSTVPYPSRGLDDVITTSRVAAQASRVMLWCAAAQGAWAVLKAMPEHCDILVRLLTCLVT